MHGRTLLCTVFYLLDRIHLGSYAASNTCERGLCESTRLCQTVGCRMEVGFLMGGLPGTAAPVVAVCTSHLGRHIGPRGRRERNSQHPPHRRCSDGVAAYVALPHQRAVAANCGGRASPRTRAPPCFVVYHIPSKGHVTIRRRFVKNSYVRQVISEGAPRAPGAQYIWFGSFLPPLARHSS